MTEEISEEHIGPGTLAAGAALDTGKVDPLLRESRERVPENAWAVLDGEYDAGLVLARSRGRPGCCVPGPLDRGRRPPARFRWQPPLARLPPAGRPPPWNRPHPGVLQGAHA